MGVTLPSSRRRRRSAGMGAPVDVLENGWAEVREYALRIDRAVRRLNTDARNQIVYTDPKRLDDIASEWGEDDTSSEAAELRARAKSRGGAQTVKDLEWSVRWDAFRLEWDTWLGDVQSMSPGVPASAAWSRQVDFEGRLRTFYTQYAQLGGTSVSEGLPETLSTASGKKEPPGGIPWAGVITVGSLIALAVFSQSIAKIIRG